METFRLQKNTAGEAGRSGKLYLQEIAKTMELPVQQEKSFCAGRRKG